MAVNSGRDHFEAGSLEYVKVSELLQRFRDETRAAFPGRDAVHHRTD